MNSSTHLLQVGHFMALQTSVEVPPGILVLLTKWFITRKRHSVSFGECAVPILQVRKAGCGQDPSQLWACVCAALLAALTRSLFPKGGAERKGRGQCVSGEGRGSKSCSKEEC